MDVIEVATKRRRQLIDVTSFLQQSVGASQVEEGLCQIYVPHTTAAVLLNENADPAVAEDILRGLEAILPNLSWRHLEGNSDAHLLSSLVGSSIAVPISGGELTLGRWQAVYLLELDGPRKRDLWVTCLRA